MLWQAKSIHWPSYVEIQRRTKNITQQINDPKKIEIIKVEIPRGGSSVSLGCAPAHPKLCNIAPIILYFDILHTLKILICTFVLKVLHLDPKTSHFIYEN